jgi:phosphoribosylaminoimidazolecarboxamide formyltransferase / IMP cyclohydrolase
MPKIERALISVTDKSGIQGFARALSDFGVRILSTGGTAKVLAAAGIEMTEVSDFTGVPEMLDGRVKTLHPKIHGGILGIRTNPEHLSAMERHAIQPIDMVVVNLYEFEKTVTSPECSLSDAVESIDIGGPTLLRAASKNYPFVTVVADPNDYQAVIDEMKASGGAVSVGTNFLLARKVFRMTSAYDRAIHMYLDTCRNP